MSAVQPVSLMRGFSRRLFLSTTVAMILAAALSLIVTVSEFNAGLRPVLEDKVRAVAVAVQRDIEYAMRIGIPFDDIRGLDTYFDDLIAAHPEVKAMRVVAATGSDERSLGRASSPRQYMDIDGQWATNIIEEISDVTAILLGRSDGLETVSVDVMRDGVVLARVEATIDESYLNGKMTSVFFDTLVILIAVSLVALEVVVVVSASQLTEPFRQAESAINRRASGELRQYQVGRGSRRIAEFIQALNAQNARLRDALTAALRTLGEGGAARDAVGVWRTTGALHHGYAQRGLHHGRAHSAFRVLLCRGIAEILPAALCGRVPHRERSLRAGHHDGVADLGFHVRDRRLHALCRPSGGQVRQ